MLQAVPFQPSNGGTQKSQPAQQQELVSVPLYHHEQARELLGLDELTTFGESKERLASLALFVHERVNNLLPEADRARAPRLAKTLIETANRHEMDPLLLMALIKQESRFNPRAVGSHGEIGLMQMKPSTAAWLAEKGLVDVAGDGSEEAYRIALRDPSKNVVYGTAYLSYLRSSFKGRGSLYLAAYNMGALNVRTKIKSGERPRIYSDRVLSHYVALTVDFASAEKVALKRMNVASNAVATLVQ